MTYTRAATSGRIDLARLALVAALLALVAGAWVQYRYGYTPGAFTALGGDDAYISFRYARNLFEGHGLVFNPGERVEGYSNLLFVLLTVPAFLVGASFAWPWSCLLNVVFTAGTVMLIHRHVAARCGWKFAAVAAGLLVAHPVQWYWPTTGMETSLVVLLQVATWCLSVRQAERPRRGVLAALAAVAVLCVMVRADGIVPPAVAALYLYCQGRRRDAAVLAAVAGATLAALTLWRLSYYGLPLPNTYYAKVYDDPLIRAGIAGRQLLGMIVSPGIGVFIVACLVGVTLNARSILTARSLTAVRFEPLLAATLIAYYVYVGGDFMGERFLLACVPLGTVLALSWFRDDTAKLLIAAAFLLTMQGSLLLTEARFTYAADKRDLWVTLGRFLGERHPEAVLAAAHIGKLAYFSGLPTIDMLGLTDPVIARAPVRAGWNAAPGHGKYDPGYVLGRAPELIAEWVADDNFNLFRDMGREAWEGAGYRVKYLVSPLSNVILDVDGMNQDAMSRLRRRGYIFAVLWRPPVHPTQP